VILLDALTWPEAFREVGNGFVHVAALLGGIWLGWTIYKDASRG
jgi:hypothetical protein